MQYSNIKGLLIGLTYLLLFVGCETNRLVDSGDSSNIVPSSVERELPDSSLQTVFTDNFETASDQDLNAHTSNSGHSYSGSDVTDFEVEASSNGLYTPGEPDGISSWWVTPDVQLSSSSYRSIIRDATLGGDNQYFHLFVGVRHDGEARGSETAYSIELAGGSVGIVLRRTNAGSTTVLASDSSFTTSNSIDSATTVDMELEAETIGNSVVLNGWITVDSGTRQHVFQDIQDTDADRITDTGSPAFGMSPIAPRIGEAEVLEEEISPAGDYWDDFETIADQDLVNRTSSSGHTYSGSDVDEFVVESSTNSTYPSASDPGGNSAWWATPDFQPVSSDYRSAMDVTMGSTENWTHTFVGVRHDGSLRGSETAYALQLRGGDGGLHLVRFNNGSVTILDSISGFANNNGIDSSTPVSMELQAETASSAVELNAWITVDGGSKQHVFQVSDSDASRITDTGRPAYGQSINLARIHHAEILEIVDIENPPGSGGGPVSADPPLLSQFDSDMVYHGKEVGDWQQTTDTQDSQYYDGLFVHMQVRDYAQANLSSQQATDYLNNASSYISRSIQVVRDGYVIPNGGVVQDWRRFSKGLYYHYQETGDQDSYDAVILLRDGRTVGTGDPAGHPEFGHASWIREMSYWLQAHTWGEKLDGTRDVTRVQHYVEYLENHLRQIRYNDYTNPSRSGDRDGMQAFYMGLAGQALIEWYEFAGNTYWPTDTWATIPDALQDVFGWMMDQGPNGAKVLDNGTSDPHIGHSFWIEDYNGSGYGLFHSWDRDLGSGTGPYSDVSNLIAPVYYWVGQHFNSQKFIELGDEVFAGAVHHQSFYTDSNYGKRYNQQYVVIFDGLEWRQEYVDAN